MDIDFFNAKVPDHHPLQLSVAGWRLQMLRGQDDSYVAIVMCGSEPFCRLVNATRFQSEAEAQAAMVHQAEGWLKDYLGRPHSGDTHFGALDAP